MIANPLVFLPNCLDVTEFEQADGSGDRAPIGTPATAVCLGCGDYFAFPEETTRSARVGKLIHRAFVSDAGLARACGGQIAAFDIITEDVGQVTEAMQ